MQLNFEKSVTDYRGKIIFLSFGNKKINLIEIKKGFSRGGHFHDFHTSHYLVSGKVRYQETDVDTGRKSSRMIDAPAVINVPKKIAHLLTAIEDTLFLESFGKEYSATIFPEYRKIVEKSMKS